MNKISAENIVGIFLVGRCEENFHYWKILYIYIYVWKNVGIFWVDGEEKKRGILLYFNKMYVIVGSW